MAEYSGLRISENTNPTMRVATPRMFCAAALGVQPNSSMAASTRARISSVTLGAWFTTRDTVPIATPATRATSCTVMRAGLAAGVVFAALKLDSRMEMSRRPCHRRPPAQ
ncbi:hypothetical protein D3C71_1414300 [compost metagenome]